MPAGPLLPTAPVGRDLLVERCRRDPEPLADGLDRDVRVPNQALSELDVAFFKGGRSTTGLSALSGGPEARPRLFPDQVPFELGEGASRHRRPASRLRWSC
jgi:hypothetical protein